MNTQPLLQSKKVNVLALAFFGIFFCVNFYLNYSKESKSYFIDLRNRIVGARLLKQDTTIYFFKWNSSQPLTLYDPYDRCHIPNNMTTSPPSLLLLMQPIADLSYSTISKVWIVMHYLFFLLIILPLYYFFRQSAGKNLVLLVGCLLLLSDHWRDSVFRGQSHFIFPAVLSIALWLGSSQLRSRFLCIGLLMAFLVWIRPNALVIIPFILLCRPFRTKQFATGLFGGLFLFGCITLLAGDAGYWIEFYETCRQWVINNTSPGTDMSTCNYLTTLEDKVVRFAHGEDRIRWHSEIVDPYHLVKTFLHINLQPVSLTIFFIVTYIASLIFFYKKPLQQFSHYLLAGILLYWLSEMTAPILKASYYYVELFVVVLFFAGKFPELLLREKLLLLASVVFTFLYFATMHLTIAELCTIACLVSYVLRNAGVTQPAPGSHDIPARY